MDRLAGKVAFVSGGASGIGEAIVTQFAAEGARVFFGDVDRKRGEQVAGATGAEFIEQDVSQEAHWESAMAQVQTKAGRLDALVNNAGILGPGALETIDVEAWDRLFAINVRGVMLGCKHGSLLMRQNPGGASGSIINMASNAALLATSADCGYSASKGAVRLMTKSIAASFALRKLPIRCNSIHPGAVDTPIFSPLYEAAPDHADDLRAALNSMCPMGRLGQPREIALMAVFLASDDSSFSTGSEFVADGGATSCLNGV